MVDADGTLLKSWGSHGPIVAFPAVDGHRIYVLNQKGILVGLDRRWLEPVWQYSFTSGGRFVSSPMVAHGSVFVGTEKEGIVRVGSLQAEAAERRWRGHLGGAGAAGNPRRSALPANTNVAWRFSGPVGDPRWQFSAPIAMTSNALLVPISGGPRPGIARLDIPANHSEPHLRWSVTRSHGVHQSPAVMNELVYFVDGQVGNQDRRLTCLDMELGQERWSRGVSQDAVGMPVADEHGVLVGMKRGQLSALSHAGAVAWTYDMGMDIKSISLREPLVIVASASPSGLAALDRKTGRQLWRTGTEYEPSAGPVAVGRFILIATVKGLQLRSITDGQLITTAYQLGSSAGPIYADRQRFAFVNNSSQLVVGNVDGLQVEVRFPGAQPVINPLVAPNGIAFATSQGGLCWSAFDGSELVPTQWTEPMEFERPFGWLVADEGRIYLSANGKEIVCLEGNSLP